MSAQESTRAPDDRSLIKRVVAASMGGADLLVAEHSRDDERARWTAWPQVAKVTALEGGEHGVTSVCVNPGYVRTPLIEKQVAQQAKAHGIPESEVLAKVMLEQAAVKRLVEPEEVAALVGWLTGPEAAMVSGASWTIDGGWSAR